MANQEDLERLKRYVTFDDNEDAWNWWRRNHADIIPDLSGADLREASLIKFNLNGADLSYANLSGANLTQAQLYQANLTRTKLSKSNLSKSNLRAAKLIETFLQEAILCEADLGEADLNGANLSGADLFNADCRNVHFHDTIFFGANLSGANLFKVNCSKINFHTAYLSGVDFRDANLSEADLRMTNFTGEHFVTNFSGNHFFPSNYNVQLSNLSNADLSGANLSGANLEGVILSIADLSGANLSGANLSGANLSGANLRGAVLFRTDFSQANLYGTNFSEAQVLRTMFGDADLSQVKGLETIVHYGPSFIGIDTIYRSKGSIPEIFLRGVGIQETFITYINSSSTKSIEFNTCFISYSNKDHAFSERLYADLQSKGVRCWFASEDMKIGDKIRVRIEEAIQEQDKLLLVLSEHSVGSLWVEKEVETAFEKESQRNKIVLFPIRLDDSVLTTTQAWAADVRRTRHIGDFTRWKNHDDYQKAFSRLLRDLKAEAPRRL